MSYSSIHIPSVLLHRLQRYICSCLPKEACGALLGHTVRGQLHISGLIPIPNVAADPYHQFEFDGATWVNCVMQEPALIGIFHSHPTSAPIPSEHDSQHLQWFGSALTIYLITGIGNSPWEISTSAYVIVPAAAPKPLLTLEPVPLCVT